MPEAVSFNFQFRLIGMQPITHEPSRTSTASQALIRASGESYTQEKTLKKRIMTTWTCRNLGVGKTPDTSIEEVHLVWKNHHRVYL